MNIIKSTFVNNIVALFKGNVVFQVTIVLTLFFLARNYTPESIGRYAVYISIITIVSTVAPGRLELALMLPKSDSVANNIFMSSLALIATITGFFGLVALALSIGNIFFIEANGFIVAVVMFGIICSATAILQAQYLNRHSKFKEVSRGKIITAMVIALLQILSVYYYKSVLGLVLSYAIGFAIGNLFYLLIITKHLKFSNFSKDLILPTLKQNIAFPTINNLSALFNIVANQGPVILLDAFYGSAISGFYAVVQRTLNAPTSLISSAFSQVFYKKITGDLEINELRNIMLKSLKYLLLIAVLILVIILIFSDFLYVFIFGEQYIVSANIAKITVVFFLARLLFSSMSTLIIAKKKLFLDLKFNIFYALSLLIPIALGWLIGLDYLTVFIILTISGTFCFMVLGVILFNINKK